MLNLKLLVCPLHSEILEIESRVVSASDLDKNMPVGKSAMFLKHRGVKKHGQEWGGSTMLAPAV